MQSTAPDDPGYPALIRRTPPSLASCAAFLLPATVCALHIRQRLLDPLRGAFPHPAPPRNRGSAPDPAGCPGSARHPEAGATPPHPVR
ncbi:hypothetical protein, partial [Streptomyces sp. NPDC002054]|uniref:hypothetical protein n=1 Tax=Streptomyces sp. NPDC002054 TaxID=3154663 RepID=UPI00332633E2